MRCHYEVLEIPQDADDSQIKRAYRRQALRWHPDKNLNDPDNAKIEFQFVQQAYDVLSDCHERAWYDKNKGQILGINKEFQDKSLNVYQYFTTTCFKGYGDDDGGFYAVYRNIFETISKEDMEFFYDKKDFCNIPTFGTSSSNYNDIVGPFYTYWLGYSTSKSYVWLDPHSIGDYSSKQYYKLMEKENKKVRLNAKQKRNEEVRALVAFVRKRDERFREHVKAEEARILQNRLKQEELSQARRLKRIKELNELKPEAEWSKFENVKEELLEIEKELAKEFGEQLSEDEDDPESELLDHSYCASCNKVFKTSKAFQNHEISKKHKENVEKLREYMEEEDEIAEGENEDNSTEENVEVDYLVSEDLTEEEEVEEVKTKKNKRKFKKVIRMEFSFEYENLLNVKVEEAREKQESTKDLVLTKKQKRRNKKSNASDKIIPNQSSSNDENLENVEMNEEVVENPKPNKKTKKEARSRTKNKKKCKSNSEES